MSSEELEVRTKVAGVRMKTSLVSEFDTTE